EIYGGMLHSLNNDNTFWNLETGLLKLENTEFVLGGSADIQFTDIGNRMYYKLNNWAAGFGVGRSINDTYSYAFIGVSRAGKPHPSDETDFSGFIVNANDREQVDDIGN